MTNPIDKPINKINHLVEAPLQGVLFFKDKEYEVKLVLLGSKGQLLTINNLSKFDRETIEKLMSLAKWSTSPSIQDASGEKVFLLLSLDSVFEEEKMNDLENNPSQQNQNPFFLALDIDQIVQEGIFVFEEKGVEPIQSLEEMKKSDPEWIKSLEKMKEYQENGTFDSFKANLKKNHPEEWVKFKAREDYFSTSNPSYAAFIPQSKSYLEKYLEAYKTFLQELSQSIEEYQRQVRKQNEIEARHEEDRRNILDEHMINQIHFFNRAIEKRK